MCQQKYSLILQQTAMKIEEKQNQQLIYHCKQSYAKETLMEQLRMSMFVSNICGSWKVVPLILKDTSRKKKYNKNTFHC